MGFLGFFRRLTLIPQGATIIAAGFLPIFAIVSMFPAVPSIIQHFAGRPDAGWKVAMMVSAPGLSIALVAPFAGLLTDRFGRRRLILMSALCYGVFGSLPFLLDNLDVIFASRILLGVAEAFILTGMNTLIGDYWPEEGRRAWLFLQGLLGPALAACVVLLVGSVTALRWNGCFLVYLVAFPIFFAIYRYLYEPTKDGATAAELSRKPGLPSAFPTAAIGLIGVVTLIASVIYYTFIINGGLAFKEVGVDTPDRLGQLTAIPSLFVMAGAFIFWLLRRAANAVQLLAFFLMLGVGLAGIGLAPDYRLMLAALIIQQGGAGMAVPALVAWAQSKLPFEHRGRGMGAWASCFFLGQFLSPWVVHRLSDATGSMQGAFLAMGVLSMAAGGLAALSLLRRTTTPQPFNHRENVA
jgi:MFS family permease